MKIEQVTGTVHLVTGTNVNWALVTDGDAVTVVDAGYPNDGRLLLASLEAIGRVPQDVQAVILTHAHLDHMGGIPSLLAEHRVPVYTGSTEVAHARRDYQEQITPVQMLHQCTSRAGLIWVAQTLKAVLPHMTMSVPSAVAVPFGEALDLPGAPVPISTPGHTSGHTAYLLDDLGVVFTGDSLVTSHPLLAGPPRPQFLPSCFSEDEAEMARSLSALGGLQADVIVPGHGPVLREALVDAVDQALRGR
ncbi:MULTISPECIES: MBL fold metallo-hydrolase [unclassified Dietzia]|uniref:MBL fold metallo-hydrolase n=1 Tax=unclassified Dietzia TaxID=2617939 RepID=UPI0015FBD112|nr:MULTISPECIES: MBL fold metallo-hydrolase [unclassified Dietzia]MBB1024652.1 MBL fold metallo-hydrolase [Dietzia sp. DQ12-76]MBB1026318.1 MBL fold metallo-hydrolase [Dietzia sp. DQ11-38-2]